MKSLIKLDRKSFVLAIVFTVLTSISMLLFPYLLGKVIDAILLRDLKLLVMVFFVDISNIALMAVADYLSNYYSQRYVKNVSIDLRKRVLNSILDVNDCEIHDEDNRIGLLLNDIDMVKENYFSCILSLVFSSCQFLVCLVLLIYYNVFVGILAFLFSLLNYYLPRMTSKKLQKYADDEALQRRRLLNRFYELIKGYSVIKSFGWIEKYLRKADRQIAETETAGFRNNVYKAKVLEFNGFITQCAQRLAYLIAGIITIFDYKSISFVTISGNYVRLIADSLNEFVSSKMNMVGIENIYRNVLNEIEKKTSVLNQESIQEFESIELCNVDFAYENVSVFEGIELTIHQHEKIAIIGPSGCDKSTLIKLIMGYYQKTNGEIKINGRIRDDYTFFNIGYLAQKPFVFNTSIKDNIIVDEEFNQELYDEAIKMSCLERWIDSLEEKDDYVIEDNGKNISGGQLQRICIARTLYHHKDFLILDAGLSSLDQETAREIEKNLLSYERITLIHVKHHLSDEMKGYYSQVVEL